MKKIRLGIIGAGNMAQAIIKGIAGGGLDDYLKKEDSQISVTVSDTNEIQLAKVLSYNLKNITVTTDNAELVKNSDFVLVAVKPQSFAVLVTDINLKDKVIISIMAGITIEKIIKICGAEKIMRVMPNLNAKIGKSVNTYASLNLSTHEEAFIAALLSSFGANIKISEDKMNAATGITGSGPAFVFMFVKAFTDAAVSYGFSIEESTLLAVKTISASAEHIAQSDMQIGSLIDSVCSKGGTTIEGVNYLKTADFENIVKTAIDKSVKRAEELGR